MTLQEYLAQMAATQGRQGRGQTNLTTAQRAELDAIIRAQYANAGTIGLSPESQRLIDWGHGMGSEATYSGANLGDVMLRGDPTSGYNGVLGQYHDQDTGTYYNIGGVWNPDGTLADVQYNDFRPEGGWVNDNLGLVAALTLAGMGGAAALGAGAGAGGAGAGAAGGAAGGTGLAAGTGAAGLGGGTGLTLGGAGAAAGMGGGTGLLATGAPGLAAMGGGTGLLAGAGAGGAGLAAFNSGITGLGSAAAAGALGSGATGAAASGAGGLLSQLGQGASTVGGFLRDNANWLAPLAGGVAGYLGTDSDVAPYTGQLSAEWTPAQQQGLDMMQAAAGNAPQVQAQMQGLLSQATAQNPMFGLENPGLTGAIDRAQQDLSRNYNTLVAPKFSMGSSFGSSGLGELEALARKDVTDAMANIGTQMRYQNYGLQANLGEAQANRAMQGVSAAGNIGMYPTQVGTGLMNAGAAQQQSNQAALDRQYQEFVRTNQPQGNPWAGALGGAMLGSQMGGFLQQPQVQAPNYMPTSYRPQAWNGVAS